MREVPNLLYGWKNPGPSGAHECLLPAVMKLIDNLYHAKSIRIVDIGCGNGYVASQLARRRHRVLGIDVSCDGIKIAQTSYPHIRFEVYSIYDDNLAKVIGQPVDCVLSLEVLEHLFNPNKLFEQSYRALRPGGYFIVSAPYHGYIKNLSISLVNGWDWHFSVERVGGHIKFFSRRTLGQMAHKAGFRNLYFKGAGRLPWVWKSMIMVAQK